MLLEKSSSPLFVVTLLSLDYRSHIALSPKTFTRGGFKRIGLRCVSRQIFRLQSLEMNENNRDELATTRKGIWHCQRSADSLRTPEFVRECMMDENCGESMYNVLPKISKCLKEE
ncbi:hypothetical protein ACTXT7_013186 [Hymenolepis weldensis]